MTVLSTTRGRSFTNFPKNTKVKHKATQAKLSRAERRKLDEIEACYKQYKPSQIFHCAAMIEADDVAWSIENDAMMLKQGYTWDEERGMYVKCENPHDYDPVGDDEIRLMYAGGFEPCPGCSDACGQCAVD